MADDKVVAWLDAEAGTSNNGRADHVSRRRRDAGATRAVVAVCSTGDHGWHALRYDDVACRPGTRRTDGSLQGLNTALHQADGLCSRGRPSDPAHGDRDRGAIQHGQLLVRLVRDGRHGPHTRTHSTPNNLNPNDARQRCVHRQLVVHWPLCPRTVLAGHGGSIDDSFTYSRERHRACQRTCVHCRPGRDIVLRLSVRADRQAATLGEEGYRSG